jgi:predicted acylesterase/phospholipase RssA
MQKMALVLQGGSALGAYEHGVVTRLIEVGWQPVAVTGISRHSSPCGAIRASISSGLTS